MMLRVHALRPVERNVRINMRGRYVGVAEDGLHRAQVGPILHHMRRAGVTQHVRTGVASRGETRFADQLPDALTCQAAASCAQEQERRTSFLSDYFPAAFQVLL